MRKFDYVTFKVTEYDGTVRAMTKQELKEQIIYFNKERTELDNFYSDKYRKLKIWLYSMTAFYGLVVILMMVKNI